MLICEWTLQFNHHYFYHTFYSWLFWIQPRSWLLQWPLAVHVFWNGSSLQWPLRQWLDSGNNKPNLRWRLQYLHYWKEIRVQTLRCKLIYDGKVHKTSRKNVKLWSENWTKFLFICCLAIALLNSKKRREKCTEI